MLAEPALDVPALVVEGLWKAIPHRAAIWSLRPAAPRVAAVEADHGLADAEILAAEAVVVLGIIAGIAERGVDRDQPRRLSHGRGEVRRVLARPDTRHGAEHEVRVGVEHDGQLGPGPLPVAFPLCSPLAEVGADVPSLEPGRVHGGHWRRIDQVAGSGTPDHGNLNSDESPPASASKRMRREAWASVE